MSEKSGTLKGIAKRVTLVVGIIVGGYLAIETGARLVWWQWIGKSSVVTTYNLATGDAIVTNAPTFWNIHPDNGVDMFMTYFVGVIVAIVGVGILYGVFCLVRWMIFGPSDYIDPCQDPNCPCARHRVEREEEAESAALAAGVAGGIIGGMIVGK
jgi:hypothetical protein